MPSHTATSIAEWDWRYRVGFDSACRHRVRSAIETLQDPRERVLMEQIYDWATSFVSLHALLQTIVADGGALRAGNSVGAADAESLERLVEETDSAAILWLPAELHELVDELLEKLPIALRDAVTTLADRARRSVPRVPPHARLFEITFGEALDGLLRQDEACGEIPSLPRGRPVPSRDLVGYVERFLRRSLSDPRLRELFGEWTPPAIATVVTDGPGFGEYWPTEIARRRPSHDELIVYSNRDSRNVHSLRTTLHHELYPGHALFYDSARRSKQFVDHGATTLVEGWATWCEWHAAHDAASRFARCSRLRLHRFFAFDDAAAIAGRFTNEVILQGFSKSRARQLALHYFQYPGLLFSYSLGARWFEDLFERISPARFLTFLSERSWGDFFRLWSL